MSTNYKTPGVYLVEKNAFANSVVEVATAIPMFIGYTEKAEYKGESVLNKPFRISSFADYRAVFGENAQMKFKVSEEEEN
jgi:Phage tail sheath protein.